MSADRPGYASLRSGRYSLSNHCYLVTFVTRDRSPLFLDFWRARSAIVGFTHPRVARDCRLQAWVLMPDHAHLLLTLAEGVTLAGTVQRMKAAATRNVRECTGATIDVWNAGFHDRAIRCPRQLRAVARYVIANPVRAGLVERVGDYPFWDAVWIDGRDVW